MHLLATDFDSTIFYDGDISKNDLEAIKKFKEAGNLFGIVTGRGLQSIRPSLKKFNIDYDFIIGLNGGVIELSNGDIIKESTIHPEAGVGIVEILKEYDLQFSMAANNTELMLIRYDESDEHVKFNKDRSVDVLDHFTNFVVRAKNSQDLLEIKERIESLYPEVNCHQNGEKLFDITQRGINKAVGISEIQKHFDLDKSQITVIGDAHNDLEMISEYNGYTVPNGIKEVKEVAKATVSNISELINDILV